VQLLEPSAHANARVAAAPSAVFPGSTCRELARAAAARHFSPQNFFRNGGGVDCCSRVGVWRGPVRMLLVAVLLVLGGCETLQHLQSAPRWMVVACVVEMHVSGELPFPRLGPACRRLDEWVQQHRGSGEGE